MYKTIRYYFRLLVAFFSKYFFLIFLGMLMAGVFLYIYPRIILFIPRMRPSHRIGIIGNYFLSDLPSSVSNLIGMGLTSIDSQGLAVPGLADHWDYSPDGRTITFHLKSNIKWQNGFPVKSRDFQYQFRDAVFSYPDDSTIVVSLTEPFAPLPVLLSRAYLKIIKSSLFNRYNIVGTGNYRISSLKINGQQLIYLDLSPVNAKSNLSVIKYYFYPSPRLAISAFKLGLLDEIEDISDPLELSKWPNTQITSHALKNLYVGVFFNLQDSVFLGQSGKNMRLSLAYALDKSNWKYRSYGPLNPDSWALNQDLKSYAYDLTKAKLLLKNVEHIPRELNLSTVPAYIGVADKIKQDWEKLNIKINITVSPDIPSDFQILLIAQVIPVDPDQYNLWHSTQNLTNLTNLNNPRIDKLLEDGRKTYDIIQRKNIYFDFQKYLLEEIPVIFLYYPETYSIIKI